MALVDTLYDLAMGSLWTNPREDRQGLFRMNRITKPHGSYGVVQVPTMSITLPRADTPYQLYELSSHGVNEIGLSYETGAFGSWTTLPDVMRNNRLLIQLFCQGRLLTLEDSWFKRLPNGNLLIAVTMWSNTTLLRKNLPIYARFYHFINNPINGIGYGCYRRTVASTVNSWNSFIAEFPASNKSNMFYYNGYLIRADRLQFMNFKSGDIIQVIRDSSLLNGSVHISSNENAATNFVAYRSVLDNMPKLAVTVSPEVTRNYYNDDVDIYIGVKFHGDVKEYFVYLQRMSAATLRQLTTREYGIDAAHVDELVEGVMSEFGNVSPEHLYIYAFCRQNSRYMLPVIDDNRIRDLSRLPIDVRYRAMIGTDATLDIWNAATLETSALQAFRRKTLKTILSEDRADVIRNIFSRDGIRYILERPLMVSGQWRYPLSASNGGGRLIGFTEDRLRISGGGNTFLPILAAIDPAWSIIDLTAIGGEPCGAELLLPNKNNSNPVDTVVLAGSSATVSFDAGQDIFVYYDDGGTLRKAILGVDYDITTSTDGETVTVGWLHAGMVTSDRFVRVAGKRIEWFISNVTEEEFEEGLPIFNGMENTFGIVKDVHPKHLYVWLSGHYLVEGIDYHVVKASNNYDVFDSRIMVVAKPDMFPGVSKSIEVLMVGLPNADIHHAIQGERGFVLGGKISYDGKYGLYADRSNWVFAGGKVLTGDDYFAEGNDLTIENTVIDPVAAGLNDRPYAIVPLPQYLDDNELTANSSLEIVERVKDVQIRQYLDYIYPQPEIVEPSVVSALYHVYSPFINRIASDILSGSIINIPPAASNDYMDILVNTSYREFLDYCPSKDTAIDRFTVLHPMLTANGAPFTISAAGLTLLQRLSKRFCRNLVVGWENYFMIG